MQEAGGGGGECGTACGDDGGGSISTGTKTKSQSVNLSYNNFDLALLTHFFGKLKYRPEVKVHWFCYEYT